MANTNDDGIKELQDQLFSSNYGLSKSFLDTNKNEVFKSNKAVNDVLADFGVGNRGAANSLRDLARVVSKTIRFTDRYNEDAARTDSTGIRSLTPMGNIDQAEQQILAQSAQQYKAFLDTCPEYRGIVNIIPQVKRAINNIVRDIMNVSELTGKCFNNVYGSIDKFSNVNLSEEEESDIARCSEKIKDIIKRNKLEEKNKRWIFESCVCGVKPIAFFPYKHIVDELRNISNNYDLKCNDTNTNRLLSGECCSPIDTDYDTQQRYEKIAVENNMSDLIMATKSKNSVESIEVKTTERMDDILDDLVDDYARAYESIFAMNYDKFESTYNRVDKNDVAFVSTESASSTPNSELIEKIADSYRQTKTELDGISDDERKALAKKGLKALANWIDTNIGVVKPEFSTTYVANRQMKQRDRYNKFYSLGKDYKMAEGIGEQMTTMSGSSSTSSKKSSDTGFDTSATFAKECLIVPYAPEMVIPINVNGEYLGFYAIEYDNVAGPYGGSGRKSRSGSFTDYIRQQGFGDDKSFISGAGQPAMAYGSADPLENSLYTPVSLYNYSATQFMNGGSDKDDEKFDVLKTVVLRVLSHRLRDPDLAENKVFKDAVMTMLRNDMLIKKRVQFTYIPPEFMCYMTYKTDDEGLPVSILDGTLFFAYLYISSIVSSGMIKLLKSSDKEKYEIDVGLQKNANYSVTELQKTLSTRSLYSSGMFGSLSSVIKNAGSYQRLIIPVIKGNKLYDVQQMERYNNLDPDDNYTKELLQSVLDGIYINSGSFSEMDSVDFAKQLFTRQMEYRNNIIDAQNNYFPNFITKQVRLLTKYSSYSTYNSEEDKLNSIKRDSKETMTKIDLAKIDVKPSIPTYLSMTNIVEHISQAKDVASNFAEVFALEGGNESDTNTLNEFKKKIIQEYVQIVDWDKLESLLETCKSEAKRIVISKQKSNVIDEKLQQPTDEEGDLNPTEIDGGSGSSDMGGMDTGGDFGGGDLGGMDDMSF